MTRISTTLIALTTALLASSTTLAGPIADVFDDGVFGTRWGDSYEEVEEVHPGGHLVEAAGTVYYRVTDSRQVLELERADDAWILFQFDAAGRLNGVGVQFDEKEFSAVLKKLDILFGKHFIPEYQALPDQGTGVVQMKWPEDEGVELSLALLPPLVPPYDYSETVFGVEYNNLRQPKANKKKLGFK